MVGVRVGVVLHRRSLSLGLSAFSVTLDTRVVRSNFLGCRDTLVASMSSVNAGVGVEFGPLGLLLRLSRWILSLLLLVCFSLEEYRLRSLFHYFNKRLMTLLNLTYSATRSCTSAASRSTQELGLAACPCFLDLLADSSRREPCGSRPKLTADA